MWDRTHRLQRQRARTHRPPREEVLATVVECFMEPVVSERLGNGRSISPESSEVMQATIASWARNDQEADDLRGQAWELAEETVEREWPVIEPLARGGGPLAFRGPARWPKGLMNVPLHPVPPSPGIPAATGAMPRAGVRHRAAHAIVGAIACDTPISVGFSGFHLPGRSGAEATMQALLAGQAVDAGHAPAPGSPTTFSERCGCRERWQQWLLRQLGLSEEDLDRAAGQTWGEGMRTLGREQEAHDLFMTQWVRAAELVDLACTCGYLDEVAMRLERLGRVVVEPAEARAALGVTPGNP